MSHFTVLVVGDNTEEQLAPFHEFECTGDDNKYVQNIDQTDEARKEYESYTKLRYQDPEGNLHNPYQDQFYREFTEEELKKHGNFNGKGPLGMGGGSGISWTSQDWNDGLGYRSKVHFLPEGWKEVRVNANTVESFRDFVEGYYGHKPLLHGETPDLKEEHKYGWTQLDEKGEAVKVIDRTNPNKHWDWYKVGGRWNGFFKLKAGASGAVGEPGLNRMDPDYEEPEEDRADLCMKGDIDIEGMKDEAGAKAAEQYDLFASVTEGCPAHLSWKEVQDRNRTGGMDEGLPAVDWGAARKEYGEQPAIKALRDSKDRDARWFDADDFLCTREKYIERARKGAFSTFAVVKDGQWYERGEMGWWGAVHDEKDEDQWLEQFSDLIDSLPDSTL